MYCKNLENIKLVNGLFQKRKYIYIYIQIDGFIDGYLFLLINKQKFIKRKIDGDDDRFDC